MDFLRTLLQDVPRDRRSHVFDIGANEGGYTHLLLEALPRAHVHAFEPLPVMAKQLFERYGWHERVSVWKEGISHEVVHAKGLAVHEAWTLDYPDRARRGRNATYGGDTFDVTFTTVDTYVAEMALDRVDFLKIDTDGYEFRVLQGARETLLRDRPPILIELGYMVGDLGDDIDAFLRLIDDELHYRLYAQDGTPLPYETAREWYPWRTTFDVAMLPAEVPLRPLD